MKPLSSLTLATGLMFAAGANAELRIESNGIGDALYFPYYSAQSGQTSLLSISNTGDTPTLVKLLFAEAFNGQNVLALAIALPPHATWSGALSQQGDGARLTSQSEVCSIPQIGPQGFPAVNFDYRSDGNHPDDGGDSLARTLSGSVELIELGALAGQMGADAIDRDCAGLELAYTATSGTPPDRSGQILAPTSQISAALQIITVQDGIVYPVPSHAISGFATSAQDPEAPGVTLPRLATPQLAPLANTFEVATSAGTLVFDGDRGADAMSALFMTSQLAGPYYVDPDLGSTTLWAVSFPTKFAYVHERPGSLATPGNAEAPFSASFADGEACEQLDVTDNLLNGDPLVAAGPGVSGDQIELCLQTNLVAPSVDATANFNRRIGLTGDARQIQARDLEGNPVVITGLPAAGVQISNFVNGQLQAGVLANYSIGQRLHSAPISVTTP